MGGNPIIPTNAVNKVINLLNSKLLIFLSIPCL
uniref:Uncharacterized protein n=1 Tax=Anguilla anguilla TaxID=7936 RepID=A0A0E9UV72_ANGAN